MQDARRFGTVSLELGEGPMWSPAEQAFYWFDVIGRRLYRQRLDEAEPSSWALEKQPGCFSWRKQGGVVFAFRNGLALAPGPQGPFTALEEHGIDFAVQRFNDGRADRAGRFWIGAFNPRFAEGGGSLYRLDPDLSLRRMDSGITMSNGMGWSPDDRVMYFCDSRPGCIWMYDFDLASGEVESRRPFIDYADRPGRPDGLTVDLEGFVWVAEVTAGRIARYDPDGALERTVALPVSRPTSLIFGGPEMRTLLITSMRQGLSADELASEPAAGGLFTVECEAAGAPESLFDG